jgi:hypothetical protein
MSENTRNEARLELEKRKIRRRVYATDDGVNALTEILWEHGYFATTPEEIRPENIAYCNRLLWGLGVMHGANYEEVVRILVDSANDRDLDSIIGEKQGDE